MQSNVRFSKQAAQHEWRHAAATHTEDDNIGKTVSHELRIEIFELHAESRHLHGEI
jgi:hypothetical protein